MNVYVRELVSALAQAGHDCRVYVRRWDQNLPDEVVIEPGARVVHVDAGPPDLAKEHLPEVVDRFADEVERDLIRHGGADVIHANYWLSGVAGHTLKHRLEVPLVATFHTLARVKAETGDPEPRRRVEAEALVIGCSDVITASCTAEADELVRLYGADPARVELVPPGVEHALFSPGERSGARTGLGLGPGPVLLFAGRIQPLKGLDVAIESVARLQRRDTRLVVVGGPSGTAGEVEHRRCRLLADRLGVGERVHWIDPQPHHLLSSWYRAADAVLVPSRSESFGLVALEAAACGIPVVAAAVGGLRTLVDHGETGFLVEGRDPAAFAAAADTLLGDPQLAAAMSRRAAQRARGYTWTTTAGRLRRIYGDFGAHRPVEFCQ
jgi:D-inositol-3-phosphate glycosyltransferase